MLKGLAAAACIVVIASGSVFLWDRYQTWQAEQAAAQTAFVEECNQVGAAYTLWPDKNGVKAAFDECYSRLKGQDFGREFDQKYGELVTQ